MKKIIETIKNEDGAMAIVEATFVFPIMFFVIFFLIFMGNMYVSRSYTDNLINETAISMAAKCADPNLSTISAADADDGIAENIKGFKNEPYRYIFNKDVINVGDGVVNDSIRTGKQKILDAESCFYSFFKGMEPQLKSSDLDIHFNNKVVSYSLEVTATYKISLPWKFIFQDDIDIYTFTTRSEVPVSDAPEFIRNIDMAVDLAQQSESIAKVNEKISALFGNNKDGENAINKFAK